MRRILFVASFAVLAAACGDNSRQCGPGTTDVDGECIGMGDGNTCGEGTVEQNGTCVPAAEACEDGETAVEGNCVQIDATEGAEPNGTELGASPAGVIVLAPGPDRFTVTGCMNNQPTAANDDPDFDRYQLTVTEPTLVKLAVDGRGGMVGGFYVAAAEPDPMFATFERYGVSVASDMSRRQVFLPQAGVYDLVVSDTRTLIPRLEGEPMPAAGNPDGTTSCYLIHAETQPLPAATPLVTGTPATGTIGEDVAVFSSSFASGFNSVTASIDSAHARASLVVTSDNEMIQITGLTDGGNAVFGGVGGATTTLVLDPIVNYGLAAADYTVAIDFMMESTPLPRDGSSATPVPSRGQEFITLQSFNLFHWEVTEADITEGIDLTFSIPMAGVITDRTTLIVSPLARSNAAALNGAPDEEITETFTRYTGLVRTRVPGTYYLVLYAPRNPVGTPITVKSTITKLEEVPVAFDAETAPQVPNAFNSNPFLYDAGEVPWQLWNARGTATGDLVTSFYDPATAVGRLDSLAVVVGFPGTPISAPSTVPPLVQHAFAQNGSRPLGRIVQDPVVPEDLTTLFVKVNPVRKTGATRQFTLDFGPQAFHDFGDLASGTTSMINDQPLNAANQQRRFFFEAPPNSTVTITVHPDTATLNPVLSLVDVDEQARIEVDDGIANQDETYSFTQPSAGFTAFVVSQALPVVTPQAFTVTVTIDPPAYSLTTTATAFVDICTTGGVVHPADEPIGDEGLTDAIPTVPGFDFFGAPAPAELVVSTNGFLSFDPAISDSNYIPVPIPDAVGETSIAPLWEDLWFVTICSKTEGTRQTIQWTGEDFSNGDQVEIQAILDASDDSIEFVWGPGTTAPGTSGSSGIQALGGVFGFGVGAFSEFVVPGTSRKLTPAP